MLDLMTFKPSAEQRAIGEVDFGAYPRPVVIVEAPAGSGKTKTAEYVTALQRYSTLYLVLNKANAAEARERFPDYVAPFTLHSFAWQTMQRRFGHKLEAKNLNLESVVLAMGLPPDARYSYDLARMVSQALAKFFNSTEEEIQPHHCTPTRAVTADTVREILAGALIVWKRMCDPADDFKITHDGYLKLWFHEGHPPVHPETGVPFSLVMVDEFQDSNRLTVAVTKRWYLEHNIALYVTGDIHQSIYEFRGSVNALDDFLSVTEKPQRFRLTTSYRFTPHIAQLAEKVIYGCKGIDFRVVGAGKPLEKHATFVTIGRTNASLFLYAVALIRKRDREIEADPTKKPKRIHFVGTSRKENYSPEDALKLSIVRDMANLREGRKNAIKHPAIKYAPSFWDLMREMKANPNPEIAFAIQIVLRLKADTLMWVERVIESAGGPGISHHLVSAHRSKGLEWDAVQLLDDFAHPGMEGWYGDDQDTNLLYIAITRTHDKLIIGDDGFTWWLIDAGCDLPDPPTPRDDGKKRKEKEAEEAAEEENRPPPAAKEKKAPKEKPPKEKKPRKKKEPATEEVAH